MEQNETIKELCKLVDLLEEEITHLKKERQARRQGRQLEQAKGSIFEAQRSLQELQLKDITFHCNRVSGETVKTCCQLVYPHLLYSRGNQIGGC